MIVVIVAISTRARPRFRKLFSLAEDGTLLVKDGPNINAYLVAGPNVIVEPARKPRAGLATMLFGNMPRDGVILFPETKKASFSKRSLA